MGVIEISYAGGLDAKIPLAAALNAFLEAGPQVLLPGHEAELEKIEADLKQGAENWLASREPWLEEHEYGIGTYDVTPSEMDDKGWQYMLTVNPNNAQVRRQKIIDGNLSEPPYPVKLLRRVIKGIREFATFKLEPESDVTIELTSEMPIAIIPDYEQLFFDPENHRRVYKVLIFNPDSDDGDFSRVAPESPRILQPVS